MTKLHIDDNGSSTCNLIRHSALPCRGHMPPSSFSLQGNGLMEKRKVFYSIAKILTAQRVPPTENGCLHMFEHCFLQEGAPDVPSRYWAVPETLCVVRKYEGITPHPYALSVNSMSSKTLGTRANADGHFDRTHISIQNQIANSSMFASKVCKDGV